MSRQHQIEKFFQREGISTKPISNMENSPGQRSDDEIDDLIREYIDGQRLAKHLSVRQLALQSGIAQQQLAKKLKKGGPAFRWVELSALAETLETSVEATMRAVGLLPDVDSEEVFDNDPRLTAEWRQIMKASYQTAVEESRERSNRKRKSIGRSLDRH